MVQGLSTFLLFVCAALAAMLAGHVALSPARGRGLAVAFLLGFTLQTVLLGVQWLRPDLLPAGLRAATGAALPGLLFLFFARSRSESGPMRGGDAWHAAPVAVVAGLVAWPGAGSWIDITLLMIELGYALALLSSDRRDASQPLRRRARLAAAAFLLSMAACDVWISWELAQGEQLVSARGTRLAIWLLLATVVALFAWAWRDPEWLSRLRGGVQAALPAPMLPEVADDGAARALCARLDQLFQSQRAYAEFGIGLDDIARRLSVSPRELSGAVNRIHGRGFRTLLNDRRVDDAARQLADAGLASKPITEIMFDAGFQTKSNFNKEFAARQSASPSQYRRQHRTGIN